MKPSGINILYIDDEPDLLDLGRTFLERNGRIRVDTVISPAEALEKLSSTVYDAIVSDYQMPAMNGIEFLKVIRSNGNSTPFIIFTGKGRETVVIEALNSGADFYLQKGGEPMAQFAELENKIEHAVELRREREALEESEFRFRAIVENTSDLIRILDPAGRIIFDTRVSERVLGYPPGYTLGKNPLDFIHPDDLGRVRQDLDQVYRNTNSGIPTEFRIRKADGSYIWVESVGKNLIGVPGVDGIVITTRFIDERKANEAALQASGEALAESELKFRAQYMNNPHALFTWQRSGDDFVLIEYNRAAEEITSGRSARFLMKTDRELYAKRQDIREILHCSFNTKGISSQEIRSEHFLPGRQVVITAAFVPPDLVMVHLDDITHRRQAEEMIVESREKYRALYNNAVIGIYRVTPDGRFLDANLRAARILGYDSADELIRSINCIDTQIYTDPDQRLEAGRLLRENGFIKDFEASCRHKDGHIVWVSFNARLVRDEQGKVLFHEGTSEDITERKTAQQELQVRNAQLRAIIEGSPIPTFVIDQEHRVISWNRALAESTRIKPRDIVGTTEQWRAFYPAERACLVDLLVDGAVGSMHELYGDKVKRSSVAEGGYEVIDFFPFIGPSGTWFSVMAAPVINERGAVIGGVETLENITAIKEAEQSLRKSEQRYCNIIEDQTEFICRFLPDGTHVFVNEAYASYFGKARDEIIGKIFRPNIHPDDRDKVRRFFLSLSREHPVDYIGHRIIMPGGEVRWQRWSDRAIFDDQGALTEYQSVGRDITVQKQIEEALRRANDQLKILTRITSHDIRNKVTVVLGYLYLVRQRSADPEAVKYLGKIDSVIRDIQDQIEFTKIYQDLGGHEPQWHNTRDLISDLHVPAGITVTTRGTPTWILADPMLKKVFSNLLDNSIRHGEGVTGIIVEACSSEAGFTLAWEDNGVGIAAGDKEKIFDRGYGKNTGLGLFLAREILSLTGISIRETGIPGRGARFEMLVPQGAYRSSAGF